MLNKENSMASKFQLKIAKNGKHFFSLVASNGQVTLSSEMYESRAAALNGIKSVQKNAAREGGIQLLSSTKGQPYFVVVATNKEVVGKSQMYASSATRSRGVASVKKNAPTAETEDLTK
jgi:uncharacterized protein